MQAWNQVKVNNPDSAYNEHAGFVIRVEHDGENEKIFVRMDTDETVQPFATAELQLLG
jgi:hypothetical protein